MVATVSSKHTFKLPHLHVLRPGSLIRNKVQHAAVLQLLCDFAYMPRGLIQVTATSFILVFICGGPLINDSTMKIGKTYRILFLFTGY